MSVVKGHFVGIAVPVTCGASLYGVRDVENVDCANLKGSPQGIGEMSMMAIRGIA